MISRMLKEIIISFLKKFLTHLKDLHIWQIIKDLVHNERSPCNPVNISEFLERLWHVRGIEALS